MAKKQEAEKELAAKNAELQGADTKVVKDTETIESEADSNLINEIKSSSLSTPEGDFDWDFDHEPRAPSLRSNESLRKLRSKRPGKTGSIVSDVRFDRSERALVAGAAPAAEAGSPS